MSAGRAFLILGSFLLTTGSLSAKNVPAKPTAAQKPPASVAHPVDSMVTSPQEIATADVLTEICPTLLKKNQLAGFQTGYHVLLVELMPDIKSPEQLIKTLRKNPKYQKLLVDARDVAAKAPAGDNLTICTDLIDYRSR